MGVLSEQQIGGQCVAEEQLLQLENHVVVSPLPITNEEAECLKELRKLIKGDEELRDIGVEEDEEFLLAFVRGKRCCAEKAFKTLQSYIQIRKVKYPKFFQDLSPRKWRYLLDTTAAPRFCGVLKHSDREGRIVAVSECSKFNPRVHKGDDVIETFVTAGLELLRTDHGPRNGLVLVIDASGFGFRHAREITMSRVYMFLQIFLGSYPIKYKGFHILNNAYLFDTILTVIKQLIPKKLRERIHLHGTNYASLHEHVPREILPQAFGGNLSEDDAYHLDFEQRILDKTEHYEKMAQNW